MAYLEVSNICKSFGNTQILKGINFTMEKGQILSLIGSSGSGKTTLLRCMNFLEIADDGVVSLDGEVVLDAQSEKRLSGSEKARRQSKFGLVFQQFNLFPQYSVKKNLLLAPSLRAKADKKNKKLTDAEYKDRINTLGQKADALLAKIGLSEKADAFPTSLSGGQQQRVAIARALMLDPEILCFDEPTSALDPELTNEVLKVIRDLGEDGRTMIIVTHELEFARRISDKIIFMANGKIEETGTPEEVFGYPKSEILKNFLANSQT